MWRPQKVSPHIHLMLLYFQSSRVFGFKSGIYPMIAPVPVHCFSITSILFVFSKAFSCILGLLFTCKVLLISITVYLDTELCNQKINMSSYNNEDLHSFRLKLSQQHYYPHNLDCQLQIQALRDSENIMFYFKYFDVRPYQLPESYCNYDWLELHDGNSTENQYVCGMYLYNVVVTIF